MLLPALRKEQKQAPERFRRCLVQQPTLLLETHEAHGNRPKWVLHPERVSEQGLEGLLKGKNILIPGKVNWFLVKLMKLCPTGLKMRLLERLFRVYNKH